MYVLCKWSMHWILYSRKFFAVVLDPKLPFQKEVGNPFDLLLKFLDVKSKAQEA